MSRWEEIVDLADEMAIDDLCACLQGKPAGSWGSRFSRLQCELKLGDQPLGVEAKVRPDELNAASGCIARFPHVRRIAR